MCFHLQELSICKLNQVKRELKPMKVWCLKCFICNNLSDEQSALDVLWKIIICWFISFLSLQLNEFLQSEIKQKLSSVQKITCITAIADNKIISVVYVSWVPCSPPQIKFFLQLGTIFSWNSQQKRKKANQQLYVN